MTKEQLEKFIKIRNESPFNSNMQFQIDANAAGFDNKELGEAQKIDFNDGYGWQWITPHGRLIESPAGRLTLLN